MSIEAARELSSLYDKRKQLSSESRTTNDKINTMHDELIRTLMKYGITSIDTQTNGEGLGPFYMIEKQLTKGKMTKDRNLLFNRFLLQMQQQQPESVNAPKKIYKLQKKFLEQYATRSFVVKRVENVQRFWTVDELNHWLRHGDD